MHSGMLFAFLQKPLYNLRASKNKLDLERGMEMITMQYNITLPSDYDMNIIRDRVSNNGSKTDGFPGLEMKAYLIAEKGRYCNHENQYAPFYLWQNTDGMNQFLLSGPFQNILDSFGFPQVKHWIVLHSFVKKKQCEQWALIKKIPIMPYSDFSSMCDNELENFESWKADDGTLAYVTCYSPATWELCRFHLSSNLDMLQKLSKGSLIYDVHHIS